MKERKQNSVLLDFKGSQFTFVCLCGVSLNCAAPQQARLKQRHDLLSILFFGTKKQVKIVSVSVYIAFKDT
jgi:hypothetical protein